MLLRGYLLRHTAAPFIARGEIAAYRIGNEYRFTRGDLEAFLARQRVGGGEASGSLISNEARGDRFTARARAVLDSVREEAGPDTRHYVDTDHLLLALVRDRESVASRVLGNLAVGRTDVCRAVASVRDAGGARDAAAPVADVVALAARQVGERVGDPEVAMNLTPQADRVFRVASDEAVRLGVRQVGTRPLLLALLRVDDSVAARALRALGVAVDDTRTRTAQVLRSRQVADD